MKNKGIVIELTALLDVILIMLFWVMLNMEQETDKVKADTAEKMRIQAAEFEEKYGELEDELNTVQREFDRFVEANSESIAAANQKALDEFAGGRLITLNLSYDAVGTLVVLDENGEIGHTLISTKDDVAEKIGNCLKSAGLGKDDVILCALVYDGGRALYSDVKLIKAAADDVGKSYGNFYCTYINISR